MTGLRISELAGLTFDRVDLDNKKILIDRQLVTTKPISFGSPKHDKIRTITLTDTAIQIIKAPKKRQAEYKLLTENTFYNMYNFVFMEDNGDPCDKKQCTAISNES